jgi:hypothetical protein
MVENKKPLISTPLPDFLKPVFEAYAHSGIHMVLEKIENDVIFIKMDRRFCGG